MTQYQPPIRHCTVCHADTVATFVEIPHVPVILNVLWPERAAAQAVKRVDIPLAFCHTCGHIYNPTFDLARMDYSQPYENSLHFSPRFQRYAETLAADLVARHQLHHKQLIDVGGGAGDFLHLLVNLGDNQGVLIDPTSAPTEKSSEPRITFIADYYGEKYAHLPADFVYFRHVLEHIPQPAEFLHTIRRTIGDRQDVTVFCEVPNALFTLRDLAVWDIIYEHCSYFTSHSLAQLFTTCGFQVTDIRTTFDGQFLCVEAVPAAAPHMPAIGESPAVLAQDVASFAEKYRSKVAAEEAKLAELRRTGKQVVIWGAGSKGITFLNTLQQQEQIRYAVDLNPRKHGMYITGSGQQIVPPAFLATYKPEVVIVMNPAYGDEISQMLTEMGLAAELMFV